MKNKIIIFISLIVVIVVMVVVLVFLKTDEPQTIFTEDEVKFKEEYESLNGIEYKEDHLLKTISIVNDNNIKYVSDDEIISLLENGTNIIYLGWPECNWCRSVVPVLIDVAKSNEIDDVVQLPFVAARLSFDHLVAEHHDRGIAAVQVESLLASQSVHKIRQFLLGKTGLAVP